jgi:hypothetical protein
MSFSGHAPAKQEPYFSEPLKTEPLKTEPLKIEPYFQGPKQEPQELFREN